MNNINDIIYLIPICDAYQMHEASYTLQDGSLETTIPLNKDLNNTQLVILPDAESQSTQSTLTVRGQPFGGVENRYDSLLDTGDVTMTDANRIHVIENASYVKLEISRERGEENQGSYTVTVKQWKS